MGMATSRRTARSGLRGRPPGWPPTAIADEHEMYPTHEQDSVPENGSHELLARYLRDALAARFPDKWATGNICMYWEERNFHQYAAPDVLIVDCPPPDPVPNVHLKWSDPPALLVIELGSRSTFERDEGPKLVTFGLDLEVPEYLYYHPIRHDLRFYRLGEHGYEAVPPGVDGRVHSETLDVWFGEDEKGSLRVYTPAGEALPNHAELARAREDAEARAQEAQARAREEAEARAAAERRLAELEAELRRLRSGGA